MNPNVRGGETFFPFYVFPVVVVVVVVVVVISISFIMSKPLDSLQKAV